MDSMDINAVSAMLNMKRTANKNVVKTKGSSGDDFNNLLKKMTYSDKKSENNLKSEWKKTEFKRPEIRKTSDRSKQENYDAVLAGTCYNPTLNNIDAASTEETAEVAGVTEEAQTAVSGVVNQVAMAEIMSDTFSSVAENFADEVAQKLLNEYISEKYPQGIDNQTASDELKTKVEDAVFTVMKDFSGFNENQMKNPKMTVELVGLDKYVGEELAEEISDEIVSVIFDGSTDVKSKVNDAVTGASDSAFKSMLVSDDNNVKNDNIEVITPTTAGKTQNTAEVKTENQNQTVSQPRQTSSSDIPAVQPQQTPSSDIPAVQPQQAPTSQSQPVSQPQQPAQTVQTVQPEIPVIDIPQSVQPQENVQPVQKPDNDESDVVVMTDGSVFRKSQIGTFVDGEENFEVSPMGIPYTRVAELMGEDTSPAKFALLTRVWDDDGLVRPSDFMRAKNVTFTPHENIPETFNDAVYMPINGVVSGTMEYSGESADMTGGNEQESSGLFDKNNNNGAVMEIGAHTSVNSEIQDVSSDFVVPQSPAEARVALTRMVERMTTNLIRQSSDGVKQMQIQLHPENMGNIVIKLQSVQGVLNVKIITSNTDVKDMLAQSVMQMTNAIRNQGVQVAQIDVSNNQQPQENFDGSSGNNAYYQGQQQNGNNNNQQQGGRTYKEYAEAMEDEKIRKVLDSIRSMGL